MAELEKPQMRNRTFFDSNTKLYKVSKVGDRSR